MIRTQTTCLGGATTKPRTGSISMEVGREALPDDTPSRILLTVRAAVIRTIAFTMKVLERRANHEAVGILLDAEMSTAESVVLVLLVQGPIAPNGHTFERELVAWPLNDRCVLHEPGSSALQSLFLQDGNRI